ncbi:DUF1853 family protein [Paraferrimonas sedimenticola]|uniref:DUF1853 family protein n=1 Tax=Paraferrimonas sedimenticola TaxID=375674 RepID=A0AA37W0W2_9GAMM|nr:DUF1853 family protein [Paraferrimonas sedimenticola]GLP96133.1 hypothetical protein GCM10007895_14390 [Paraferrimonas sedimenticola]
MTQSSVADKLEWLLKSSPLMRFQPPFAMPGTLHQAFVDQGLKSLQALNSGTIEAPELPTRIGFQFEALVLWLLEQDPHYKVIAHNQAFQWQGQTLGAIDFILEHLPSGQVHHWEVAVKFYLAIEQNGERRYLGPNAKDELAAKSARMHQRQLTLLAHPAAKAWLTESGISIDASYGFSRGIIYYPPHLSAKPDSLLLPEHGKGLWSHETKAPDGLNYLKRDDWLCQSAAGLIDQPERIPAAARANDQQLWMIVSKDWPFDY